MARTKNEENLDEKKIDRLIEKKMKRYLKNLKNKIDSYQNKYLLLHEHTLQCAIYSDIKNILEDI